MNNEELSKLTFKERLELLNNNLWPFENICLNIECDKWTEKVCMCDGTVGCCD